MRVLVAGAGVGGLTLAAALEGSGAEVVVLERAPALAEVGAGITMQANAMLALASAGLGDAVAAAGHELRRVEMRDARGRLLNGADVGRIADRLGAPMIALRRSRLQQALVGEVRTGEVRLGAEVVAVRQGGGGVVVSLADGSEVRGDLLVGADGLRSAVRAAVVADGEPSYAGYVAWRGLVEGRADSPVAAEYWGRGQRFGIVPLGEDGTYWFGAARTPRGGVPADEGVTQRFAGWPPEALALVSATPPASVLYGGVHARRPLRRWRSGRIVLIGDAAHPMTPDLGQGGAQAVEDAVTLARCLRAAGAVGLDPAVDDFLATRVRRANGFVRASARAGAMSRWESRALTGARALGLRAVPEAGLRVGIRAGLTRGLDLPR